MHRPRRFDRRLLVALALVAGCDVFDARRYQDAAADMTTVGAVADLAAATAVVCGRASPDSVCPGPYLFCDGFEAESGADFNAWTNFLDQGANGGPNPGTNLVVDHAPVCLGHNALHAKTVGATQQAFVYRQLSDRPGTLHVRFYFYLSQYSQQPFQIVGFHAPSNDFAMLYVDPATSSFHYANSFSGLVANFSGASLPLGQWLCLELTTRFDARNGSVQLALDGNELGDVSGAPTEPAAMLDTVNVGIIYTAPGDSGTNDVSFDEVAFSDRAIGCR